MKRILEVAACGYFTLGMISIVGVKEVFYMLSVCVLSSVLGVVAAKIKKEL
tara:strand:+ start:441 stop:593 length:153 start_codon:yes stop_codon:yes gene_type:complete